jgi:transposase
MSVWVAAAGFCPAKRTFFLGFRLHLLVDSRGGMCDVVLSPAAVGERRVAEHLLAIEADRAGRQGTVRPLLADNGYCGDWLAGLFGRGGGALWVAPRRKRRPASPKETTLRAWHRAFRARIESVFGMLADQFRLETTRARSLWDVMTRVVAKLLAYMVGFVINETRGSPGTALKSLYQ